MMFSSSFFGSSDSQDFVLAEDAFKMESVAKVGPPIDGYRLLNEDTDGMMITRDRLNHNGTQSI